jgi:hypothetical protein
VQNATYETLIEERFLKQTMICEQARGQHTEKGLEWVP